MNILTLKHQKYKKLLLRLFFMHLLWAACKRVFNVLFMFVYQALHA